MEPSAGFGSPAEFGGGKRRRGQVKIQQMAFVMLAVTLLFVLVGMFFLAGFLSGLRDRATEIREDDARLLASKLANSPEFSCSKDLLVSDCIDFDKLMALKNHAEEYGDFWGVKKLSVIKAHPAPSSSPVECNQGNYPDCDYVELIPGEESVGVSGFAALCRKEIFNGRGYDRCEIARIIVGYEAA